LAQDDRRDSQRGGNRNRGSERGAFDRKGGKAYRNRDGGRGNDRERRFNDRKPYGSSDRDPRRRDQDPQGRFERDHREQKPSRAGYRQSRPKAPEIDEEVTGKELDKSVLRELRVLEKDNAEAVGKHLVMASQYLEVDPEFALEHAQAAVRRGGRVAAVREAAAIAAYVAERFDTALRELRTHRRMTGSNEHIALIVDSERALGRGQKALETAQDPSLTDLTGSQKAELAMVVSGIHRDQGDLEKAKSALEIPELNRNKAFSYSPRLFSAYADVLEDMGRAKEATSWARLAVVAEAALGQGQFEEPEIYEIEVLPDEEPAAPAPDDEEGVDLTEAMIDQKETGAPGPTDELSSPDHEELTPAGGPTPDPEAVEEASREAEEEGDVVERDETGLDPETQPVQETRGEDD
jgi:tetratricopeptide (TPR) repeat protein